MSLTSVGRYEVRSQLGIGGFAVVHLARDPSLDADVAVKVLLAQYTSDDDIRSRFIQEARLLRRVSSPNVIDVFDIGELDDGTPYFVMEFVDGGSLADRLDRRGGRAGVDLDSLLAVIEGLERGLGAFHATGVVHRDVKPDNLLIARGASSESSVSGGSDTAQPAPAAGGTEIVDRPSTSESAGGTEIVSAADQASAQADGRPLLEASERVLLTDLGFAKDTGATAVGPTVAGGTPHFRAPEQMVIGAEITPATDVYGATALVWQMVTGELPPAPEALSIHLPGLPGPLQAVVEKGMHIDPDMRHASIAAWAGDLRSALGGGVAETPQRAGATSFGTSIGSTTIGADSQIGDVAELCPYKGMAAFQPEDAGLFYGRSALLESLVARLNRHPVLVVGGPSGSGKSSLVRAGLIPRLQRGAIPGSQRWNVALFTPGSDPVGELIFHLDRMGNGQRPLVAGPELPHQARRLLAETPGALIVVDQFEELFTLTTDPTQRELFLDTLAEITGSAHSTVRVVVSMRADFYAACAAHPWLAEQINAAQLLVGAMNRMELREAITVPAQRTGLRLEEGLADLVLDDVGADVGALPLLGHALVETWLRRRGSTLTIEGYRSAGGVSGAIAQRAEDVCSAMSESEQEATRRLMLRLTNPGEGTPDTRRRVPLEALRSDPEMEPIVDRLSSARLLTVDDSSVEVTHEALLQSWPRLRRWIDGDREQLQFRRRLNGAAADWVASARTDDLLYRGAALETAIEWLDARALGEVEADTEAFVEAARAHRDALEVERQAAADRSRRNRRRAVSALSLLTVAALVASVIAFSALSRSRANERAAEDAVAQALGTAAAADADSTPLTGLALALESIARAPSSNVIASDALVTSRARLSELGVMPQEFGEPIPVGEMKSVAITENGALFITGSTTGDVVVWDRSSRSELARFPSHDEGVESIAVSPDGNTLVSVGGRFAIAWDLGEQGPAPRTLVELAAGARMWDAAFSPDGQLVALATEGNGVYVVPLAGAAGNAVTPAFVADAVDFLSVTFLDDRYVAAGDGRGAIWVIDGRDGGPVPQDLDPSSALPGVDLALGGEAGNDVWELVVDRSSNTLLTSSDDNTVRRFSMDLGALPAPLTPIEAPLSALADPRGIGLIEAASAQDERAVIVGDGDGRLHVFDRDGFNSGNDAALAVSSRAHVGRVIDVSVRGGWVATLGDDQFVQVWRVLGVTGAAAPVVLSADVPTALALSPDEQRLAVATVSDTLIVDLSRVRITGEGAFETDAAETLLQVEGEALAVTFVGDDRIIIGGRDGQLRLVDAATGMVLAEASTGATIRSVVATAEGDMAVVGDDAGRVVTWGLGERVPAGELAVHGAGSSSVTDLVIVGDDVVSVGFDGVRVSRLDGSSTRYIAVDQEGPRTVAVSSDGEYVAVGGAEERVDVIRLRGDDVGAVAAALGPSPGGVWDVSFAADDRTVVATGRDGAVQLWDWPTSTRLGPPFSLHPQREGVSSGPVVAVDADDRIWTGGPALVDEPSGSVTRFDVLDVSRACALSGAVVQEAMTADVLGDDPVRACG